MKNLLKRFVEEETGSELIQFAIVIAIVAGLAVIGISISNSAGTKMQEAADLIDNIDIPNAPSNSGGNGSGGTPTGGNNSTP